MKKLNREELLKVLGGVEGAKPPTHDPEGISYDDPPGNHIP